MNAKQARQEQWQQQQQQALHDAITSVKVAPYRHQSLGGGSAVVVVARGPSAVCTCDVC